MRIRLIRELKTIFSHSYSAANSAGDKAFRGLYKTFVINTAFNMFLWFPLLGFRAD